MSSLLVVVQKRNNWREPVLSAFMLPTENNVLGDVCLVLDEGRLYYWDQTWKPVVQ